MLQARRGEGALAAIRYWDSGSPSYRWNEVAFKAATESSSGVVTERMLALLNVAIYDATVAAWRAKYQYNRRRPAEVETRLAPAVPDPESPSYPSEHAAAESRLLAGVHLRLDNDEGLRLGRAVASVAIERARQDGSEQFVERGEK